MSTFVLFQLYGPMAAWGDVAVGEMRPSCLHPTRSAVLGLVSAALGMRRRDEPGHTGLQRSYGVAVEVRRLGKELWDFHTAQVPGQATLRQAERSGIPTSTRRARLALPGLHTSLSQRSYREDAFTRAVLWSRVEDPTPGPDAVVEALQCPTFTPYLGRRSCPVALPFDPVRIEAADLVEALRAHPPRLPLGLERVLAPDVDPPGVQVFWEEGLPAGLEPTQVLDLRDVRRGASRSFDRRVEYNAVLSPGG